MFWFALILIGISWVANTIYAHSKRLDEPIFLDHYIDTTLQEDTYITLYYLTNVNDSTSIPYVNVNGVTAYVVQDVFFNNFGFDNHAHVDQNLQTFTHHALRKIQLELNTFELEDALQDGKFAFNKVEVFFSDGRSITVPIGEITIHDITPDNDVLESLAASSSSDGSSQSMYRAKEDLMIKDISLKYRDILQDHLHVKIDTSKQAITDDAPATEFTYDVQGASGTDLVNIEFPYELTKDETFNIHTQLASDYIGYIETHLEIVGTTINGKDFTEYYWFSSQSPYLDRQEVKKIIQNKVKGGS